MNTGELRDYFTDAIRFWEPRRVLYNVVLAAIVITYFAIGYPASRTVLNVDLTLGLFILVVRPGLSGTDSGTARRNGF